jgi:uncharacterized membrane protein YphA (DoxX/SURF4 family)
LITRLAVVPFARHHDGGADDHEMADARDARFWYMALESRTDWLMSLGSLHLLIVGAGRWSLDARLRSRR